MEIRLEKIEAWFKEYTRQLADAADRENVLIRKRNKNLPIQRGEHGVQQ
jgi:hypothetical protein